MPTDERPDGLAERLAAAQRQVAALTRELNETNSGLIAVYAELEESGRRLADARVRRDRAAERARIAEELNRDVIQQLFRAGLDLQGLVPRVADPEARDRVQGVISQLDRAIATLRTAIFDLGGAVDLTAEHGDVSSD